MRAWLVMVSFVVKSPEKLIFLGVGVHWVKTILGLQASY